MCSKDECDRSILYALSVLGGKWKWLIIYTLSENEVLRYGEIKKILPAITHKMLSQQLKDLEIAQLIQRKEYHQIPPKVEYSLTAKGKTVLPILDLLCEWGEQNAPPATEIFAVAD